MKMGDIAGAEEEDEPDELFQKVFTYTNRAHTVLI